MCKCKCKLNGNVCNSKQEWNHDECVDSSSWRDGYMWNPRTCNYEWIKACKIDEYLDTKNCLCKKRLGKLLLACEDVIINTTETSIVNKKVTCKNSKCLIPCHW